MVGFAILVFPPAALLRLLEQVRPRGRGFPFSSLPWTVGHEELKSGGWEERPRGARMADDADEQKGIQPRAIMQDFSSDVRRKITEFESQKAVGVLLSAPKMIRRELQEMSVFGILTRFPAASVILCLLITAFFAYHSGITDQWTDERSMNVNGDLQAFLPEGSQVAADIAEVEKDWTTNVMIIYV